VLHESAAVWAAGAESHTFEVPARADFQEIVLGNDTTPDADPADNRYPPEG
jgi:hypothetical protein